MMLQEWLDCSDNLSKDKPGKEAPWVDVEGLALVSWFSLEGEPPRMGTLKQICESGTMPADAIDIWSPSTRGNDSTVSKWCTPAWAMSRTIGSQWDESIWLTSDKVVVDVTAVELVQEYGSSTDGRNLQREREWANRPIKNTVKSEGEDGWKYWRHRRWVM